MDAIVDMNTAMSAITTTNHHIELFHLLWRYDFYFNSSIVLVFLFSCKSWSAIPCDRFWFWVSISPSRWFWIFWSSLESLVIIFDSIPWCRPILQYCLGTVLYCSWRNVMFDLREWHWISRDAYCPWRDVMLLSTPWCCSRRNVIFDFRVRYFPWRDVRFIP